MKTQKIDIPQTNEGAAAVLAERCYHDQDFAARLRKDAKGTLKQELQKKDSSVQLSENIEIIPHENTSHQWHIVLPPDTQENKEQRLSDEQMESVTAGEILVSGVAPWLIAALIGTGAVVTTVVLSSIGVGAVAIATDGFKNKPVR